MFIHMKAERGFLNVSLLGVTGLTRSLDVEGSDGAKLVAIAASQSYQSNPSLGVVKKCIELGHESVLEHVSFTFEVRDLSRAALAQLTRHRVASYTVESQRYVDYTKKPIRYIIPPSVSGESFVKDIERSVETYTKYINSGVPCEDARFVLPQAIACNLVFTMNVRELRHVFSLRLAKESQWEIRDLFNQCLKLVCKEAPELFEGYEDWEGNF